MLLDPFRAKKLEHLEAGTFGGTLFRHLDSYDSYSAGHHPIKAHIP
jgi:hypothetical protein